MNISCFLNVQHIMWRKNMLRSNTTWCGVECTSQLVFLKYGALSQSNDEFMLKHHPYSPLYTFSIMNPQKCLQSSHNNHIMSSTQFSTFPTYLAMMIPMSCRTKLQEKKGSVHMAYCTIIRFSWIWFIYPRHYLIFKLHFTFWILM